ncbi:MAG: hypothetical protein HGB08_01790 [Candidatus Moranbacteria bacterium]|nr:hypothetical protein [Candidatus Moranbacteria bacterium]
MEEWKVMSIEDGIVKCKHHVPGQSPVVTGKFSKPAEPEPKEEQPDRSRHEDSDRQPGTTPCPCMYEF